MHPIIFQGQLAFSNFRLDALLNEINTIASPAIVQIDAVEIYLLETSTAINEATTDRICTLLNAQPNFTRKDGFFFSKIGGTVYLLR